VEPFGNGRIDGSRGQPGVSRKSSVSRVTASDEARRVLDGDVGDGEVVAAGLSRALASDQTAPGLVALVDDLSSVLLVLGLSGESKSVLWLAIGNFVDPEPFVGRADQSWQVPLNILNVVEPIGKRIVDVDDDDLPVSLALVEQCHDAQNFDLLNLASVANLFTDLADVQRVVITFSLGLGVGLGRVFPGLGESTVVPDVTVVRETVADKTQFASLDILLDGVERLLLGDLHLRVGPARNFNDHVEDPLVLIGEEGDVMEGRENGPILLDVNTMLCSVRSSVKRIVFIDMW
jgi:hypothetical protein